MSEMTPEQAKKKLFDYDTELSREDRLWIANTIHVLNTRHTPADMVIVPREPTEVQWGGIARDLMMWLDLNPRPTPESLREHFDNIGADIPEWMEKELGGEASSNHVLSKGTRAVLIYKAMTEAAK